MALPLMLVFSARQVTSLPWSDGVTRNSILDVVTLSPPSVKLNYETKNSGCNLEFILIIPILQ